MAGNNAHSAIDNLLVANTLQEIAHTQRGGGMDLLYNIKTKGNKDRYIHSYQRTSGNTEDRDAIREWYANMLRNMVEQNPEFADTLSLKEGEKRLEPYPSIMSRLKEALGF
jgi:hypothetical protein